MNDDQDDDALPRDRQPDFDEEPKQGFEDEPDYAEIERRHREAREREQRQWLAAELERIEVLAAYLPGVWEAEHAPDLAPKSMQYFRLSCRQHLFYTGIAITARLAHTVTFSLTPPKLIVDGKPTVAPAHVFGLHALPSREVRRDVLTAGRYGVCADAVLKVCEQGRELHHRLLGMVDELGAQATKRVHLLKAMRRLAGAEPREVKFTEVDILTDAVRIRLDEDLRVYLHLDDIDAELALDILRRVNRAARKEAA